MVSHSRPYAEPVSKVACTVVLATWQKFLVLYTVKNPVSLEVFANMLVDIKMYGRVLASALY